MIVLRQFVEQNLIYIIFGTIIVLSIALYFIIIRNHSKATNIVSRAFFSKGDYENFKADGDRAIKNTTISFNQNNVDNISTNDLYLKSISVGTRVLKESAFTISRVGDI